MHHYSSPQSRGTRYFLHVSVSLNTHGGYLQYDFLCLKPRTLPLIKTTNKLALVDRPCPDSGDACPDKPSSLPAKRTHTISTQSDRPWMLCVMFQVVCGLRYRPSSTYCTLYRTHMLSGSHCNTDRWLAPGLIPTTCKLNLDGPNTYCTSSWLGHLSHCDIYACVPPFDSDSKDWQVMTPSSPNWR